MAVSPPVVSAGFLPESLTISIYILGKTPGFDSVLIIKSKKHIKIPQNKLFNGLFRHKNLNFPFYLKTN